mmetsp:Transcript_18115/g.30938  ORF Transcript_18115/g.30938 Transcript_18115/m.30938 type:complete len:219 (-) Transcript_18115:656-1312(-)
MFFIHGESPDLSVIMTLHVGSHFEGVDIALNDGASPQPHNDASILEVNGSREDTKVNSLLALHGVSVDDADLAVFSSREELAIAPNNGSYESSAVEAKGVLASPSVPDVDEGVGSTGVSSSLVIGGDASHGGLLSVHAEEASVFLSGLDGPHVHVLDSCAPELVAALLLGEGHVKDHVGAALVGEADVSRVGVEDGDDVVVRGISDGDIFGVAGDGAG